MCLGSLDLWVDFRHNNEIRGVPTGGMSEVVQVLALSVEIHDPEKKTSLGRVWSKTGGRHVLIVSYRVSKRVSAMNLMGSDMAVLASHYVPQNPWRFKRSEKVCGKSENIVSRMVAKGP